VLINLMLVEVLVSDHILLLLLLVVMVELVLYLLGVGGLVGSAPLGLLSRRQVHCHLRG